MVLEGSTDGWVARTGGALLAVLGVVLGAVELLHVQAMTEPLGVVLEAVLPLVGAIALVGLGLVLHTERFGYGRAHGPRILAWVVVGMVAMVIVFGWIALHQAIRGQPFHHAPFLVVNNLIVGALAGFVIGSYDARTQRYRRSAERERVKHDFLHNVLRHHLLNRMNVVLGQVDLLRADDDEHAEELDRIAHHAGETVDRIEDVRMITRTFAGADAPDVGTQLLGPAVSTAVERAVARHGDVEVDVSVPDGVVVRADDNLETLVTNLVDNAVVHNSADEPWVGVTATADDEIVTLTVADDGPGIPADQREGLLSWDGAHRPVTGMGVGLAIVRVLVDRYDGEIWFDDNDHGGTSVCVRLRRAGS